MSSPNTVVSKTPNNSLPQKPYSAAPAAKGKIGGRTVSKQSKEKDSKVSREGQEAIKKTKTTGEKIKRCFKKIGEGLKNCFGKICEVIAKLCCCCLFNDDDDVFDIDDDVSDTEPSIKPEEDPISPKVSKPGLFKDLNKLGGLIRNAVIYRKEKRDKLSENPLQLFEQQVADVEQLKGKIAALAAELKPLIDPAIEGLPPRGQDNVGFSCYMNSAIQLFEELHIRNNPAAQSLIDADLSFAGKTLPEIEEALHGWFPVDPLSAKEIEEEEEKIKQKEQALAALEGRDIPTLQKRYNLREDIKFLKRNLRFYEDAILFKWSLLVIMQAKKYAKEKSSLVRDALMHHRDLLFKQKVGADFLNWDRRGDQQDAASYIELVGNLMKVQTPQNKKIFVGENCVSSRPDPAGCLQIKFTKKGSSFELRELIQATLDEKVRDAETPFRKTNDNDEVIGIYKDYDNQIRISGTPPDRLTFHLARFEGLAKNDAKVTFEGGINKSLDFSSYFTDEVASEDAAYRLETFVHHSGDLGGGHYTCYRRKDENTWLLMNDSTVTPLTTEQIKPQLEQAYILGFKRVTEESVDPVEEPVKPAEEPAEESAKEPEEPAKPAEEPAKPSDPPTSTT